MPTREAYPQEPTIEQIGLAATDIATAWDLNTRQAMRRGSHIVALRGTGVTGGIDPQAVDHLMDDILLPHIEATHRESGSSVILYDGDPDDPSHPDIGHIAGRLRSEFNPLVSRGDMMFMVAQSNDWYYPPHPDSNLINAQNLPYDTFVFPRGHYTGDHSRFTQSEQLAAYHNYGQIYIGASGMIGAAQMVDYLNKVPENGRANVKVVRALINMALGQEIGDKLTSAVDDAKREKFQAMLEQRRRVYGPHWGNDGVFDTSFMQEVRRPDEDRELVVLWDSPEEVSVVSCEPIDLNTPEYNRAFAEADYWVKTVPIKARQIEPGKTELVTVKSGATFDTVNQGDWVCASYSGEEYRGPDDFDDIYEPIPARPGWFKPRWDPRKLIEVDRDVIFMAPWGEKQAVKKGGFLMERTVRGGKQAGKTERYGIARKDAIPDMKPVSSL